MDGSTKPNMFGTKTVLPQSSTGIVLKMKKSSKKKKRKEKKVPSSSFKEDAELSSYMKDHTKKKDKVAEEECRSTSQFRRMRDEDQSHLLRDSPSLSSHSGDNLGKERVYKKPVYKLGRLSLLQSGERDSRCSAGGDLKESPRISESCSSELVPSGLHASKRSSEERRKFSKRQTSGESSCDRFSCPESDPKPERCNLKRRSGSELESPSPHHQKKRACDSTRHAPRQQPDTYRKPDSPGTHAYRPAFQGKTGPELSGSSRDETPCPKPWEPIRFKIQKKTNLVQGSHVTCERPLSSHVTCERPLSSHVTCERPLSSHVTCERPLSSHVTCERPLSSHVTCERPLSSHVTCERPLSRREKKRVKTNTGAVESGCPPYTDRTVAKHALLGKKDAVKKWPKASPSSKGGRKGSPPRPAVPERPRNTDSLKEGHRVFPRTTEAFSNDQETQVVEELHRARSQNELRVNMVESYGELTAMDIDLSEEFTSSSSNKEEILRDPLIVLDTNILLSHLDFVKKMKSLGLGALGFPIILIPWVVMQELDALKNGKLSNNVACKAVPAVHYIYTCLKNQEPRLWGQSMQQAAKTAYTLNAENNDDRVLQCCLQYQDIYPGGTLILCTNDKNLCSKAILSGVRALSKDDLETQAERVRCGTQAGGCLTSWGPPPAERAGNRGFETGRKTPAVDSHELGTCASVLEDALQEVLSKVLMKEMKVAYGDLWEEIVFVKPPWTLCDLLRCFTKHWIAVFGNVFQRNLLRTVECLRDMLCKGRMLDRCAVRRAALEAQQLLRAFGRHSDYEGQIVRSLSALEPLLQEPSKPETDVPASPLTSPNMDAMMSEEEGSLETQPSHLVVWEVFENIWSNACQISSAVFTALQFDPGSMETTMPESRQPPPEGALSCLCSLVGTIRQLLHAAHRVLVSDCSFEDVQSLFTFICSTEITSEKPRFTANDLFRCLSRHEYREKLRVGGTQLEDLGNKLELCASARGCGTASSSWA
ncbi:transcriptional protein SWT1 isoform X2 [Brienomyrus brachyistius]|uniref:transcriptional protein SWT1 isoform X2 n=1 Tax=Brienomyrus brachyistius TaxID=42636 RepID=UPI0020B2EA18|nr:transcriptional protein SWT1 isoform X2 [Brienomyrus brachyistius]